MEIAKAKGWTEPQFDLIEESGPPHLKNFLFCVTVNGVPFTPDSHSSNKKAAKANAALCCLRSLGFNNTLES
jgi:dsRNA-specific ribonuclease